MADRATQIKKLLAEGANVNQQDDQGRTCNFIVFKHLH
jgi:hypothetical protein